MLSRFAFTIIFCLSLCQCSFAQKAQDIYFMKKPNVPVSEKDSADFIRVISEPDNSDLKLFVVNDFYPDGKPMLIGKTSAPTYNLVREGTFMEYYHDGHKKSIKTFESRIPVGDEFYYYPNGKLYYIGRFYQDIYQDVINEARDTAGTLTVQNGKGTFTQYNDDFTVATGSGPIVNGLKDGVWHGNPNDSVEYVCTYSKGHSVSGVSHIKSGKEYHFSKDIVEPEFKGGIEAFYKFLQKNIRYPREALHSDVQGKVFMSFTVNEDGHLSNLKLLRGIGSGCDEEALRVISLSPPWVPGYEYGIVKKIVFTMPISFTIQMEDNDSKH